MVNFKKIEQIFYAVLQGNAFDSRELNQLELLIKSCIETNHKLWKLEDIARMKELGFERIALTKEEIDKQNQIRNDFIQKMDHEYGEQFNNQIGRKENFYSESPGMLTDRLSIFFIRLFEIKRITNLIQDEELKNEYVSKEKLILSQIQEIGEFLDLYLKRLKKREAFFKSFKPVKIYNDDRLKNYIKSLTDL